jgi:hypothetical protein
MGMKNRLITAVIATIALAMFYYATGQQRPLGIWSATMQLIPQPKASWL